MEHRHFDEAEIRQAVSQFIDLLRLPFSQFAPGEDLKPMFVLMQRAHENPEALKRDLIALVQMQRSGENPGRYAGAYKCVMIAKKIYRRFDKEFRSRRHTRKAAADHGSERAADDTAWTVTLARC